ncbi:sterol desaturase family protein [Oleiagrimonas sp. C23AA]|uniref:sterol desaturase family protein n=1 Tax=Oleiagrimonas sp. C23AA TaxID=2719047 RepID=UPI00142256C2|nr:sterol desaturase family protein [Oleiagrimonas sp. C23AA]NII12057.1 sterol desaturase family protein [Oleiagrimonas sp. C23AA]
MSDVLAFAFPFVIGLSLIEALVLHWRQPGSYDWKAAGVSLLDVLGRKLLLALPFAISAPLLLWVWQHRVMTVPLHTGWALFLLFLAQELAYYAYHRASHRVRWFWATHSVHHSPNQLNLAAAYRLGWTGKLTGTLLFFIPVIWLGFPPKAVLGVLGINLLYQFWLHATWIPRLGWLEYVFNTPSAHRVHHASNLDYLDANYGGVLIVFDRLFGTYVAERKDEPPVYGLVHPVTTHHPATIEFGRWHELWQDLRQARSMREVAGYLFMPPGWGPHGKGQTTEDLRRQRDAENASRMASTAPAEPPLPLAG